jgi:transcriptional regulator with XRE-family HTH domain
MTLVWASYLSEIETGKKAGCVAALKRLAAALGVTRQ